MFCPTAKVSRFVQTAGHSGSTILAIAKRIGFFSIFGANLAEKGRDTPFKPALGEHRRLGVFKTGEAQEE
jgi:hypothetical protein